MLSFDLSDLFTQCRLGYVQSVGGSREVQIFGQHNDGVQVAYFDFGKHGSIPLCQTAEIGYCPTSSQGTGRKEKVLKELLSRDGALSREGGRLTLVSFTWHAFYSGHLNY